MRNALASGEFVVNLATYALRKAVNLTSTPAPRGVDELGLAGLTAVPSRLVAPPRVAESPVQLECRVVTSVELPAPDPPTPTPSSSARSSACTSRTRPSPAASSTCVGCRPIGRLGYREYVDVTDELRDDAARLAAESRRAGV